MGVTRFKRVVECDCGCDYGGNCGKKTTFLFCYNRSCDIGTLYIDGEIAGSWTDNQLHALNEVLTSNTPLDELTPEDLKKC